MAKTTVVHVTDDLDGSKDASEISFSFGGVDYVIDLSKKNASALEKVLKPYVEAATRVSGRSRASGTKAKSRNAARQDYAAIREWARGQGIEVADRGRVPADVVARYESAQ